MIPKSQGNKDYFLLMKTLAQKSLAQFRRRSNSWMCICKYLKVIERRLMAVYTNSSLWNKLFAFEFYLFCIQCCNVMWESINVARRKRKGVDQSSLQEFSPTESAMSCFGLFLCDAQQFHCVCVFEWVCFMKITC